MEFLVLDKVQKSQAYLSGHFPSGTRPLFLLPMDCIWTKISGKEILFHKAGSAISFKNLEEQISNGMKITFDMKINKDWITEGLSFIEELKNLEAIQYPVPSAIQEWRKKFLGWLYPTLQQTNKSISYLDLCFFCEQAFFSSSETLKLRFIQYPLEIQRKNLIAASIGVFMAVSLGYTNYDFLKEVFTVYLFFDAPYSCEIWSNSEKDFFLKLWRGEVTSEEMEEKNLLVEEYFQQMQKAIEEIRPEFTHKRLSKYLTWSFEKVNGPGRYFNFSQQELSDLDSLSLLVYHFDWQEKDLEEKLDKPLINFLLDKEEYFSFFFVARRLSRLLKSSLSEVKSKDDDYWELTGL